MVNSIFVCYYSFMKKIFKLFCFLLINFIIIIVIAEICFVFYWYKIGSLPNFNIHRYIISVFKSIPVDDYFSHLYNKNLYRNKSYGYTFLDNFRKDENVDVPTSSDLFPILYMGCSFTYSDGLAENETVSYVTAKYTTDLFIIEQAEAGV